MLAEVTARFSARFCKGDYPEIRRTRCYWQPGCPVTSPVRPWAGIVAAGKAFRASAPTLPELDLPPSTLPALRGPAERHAAEESPLRLSDAVPTHLATVKRRRVNPETTLENQIIRALEGRGWHPKKRKVTLSEREGRRFMVGEPGHPDVEVLLGNGLVCFLEIKMPGQHMRDNQVAWAERHRARGYVVEEVHSVEEAFAACEKALNGRHA